MPGRAPLRLATAMPVLAATKSVADCDGDKLRTRGRAFARKLPDGQITRAHVKIEISNVQPRFQKYFGFSEIESPV
jgi:hypothetical protein